MLDLFLLQPFRPVRSGWLRGFVLVNAGDLDVRIEALVEFG
jgi:hypothetical protein